MKRPKSFERKHLMVFNASERGMNELMGRLHNAFDLEGCKDAELKHIYTQLKNQFIERIRTRSKRLPG